jgi:glycerophosphoryl diester phosphodiesterase
VNQSTYVLPSDRHGEAFRKRIVAETDSENLPPPPRIDLILELKNVSDEDVMIWPRGSITSPDLIVEGEGVVQPENLTSASGRISSTSVQPTIKPGKTYRVSIESLNPRGGTPWIFWCEPGEYSIKATYTVYTGLPPFPFADDGKPAGEPQQFEISTPAVKVQVVLEQAQRPLIVAHRGLLQNAPENTLANFRACLELRLGFEFDVRKTGDGQLVCIHDETVNRTTDGAAHVSDLSLNEIRKLDAGRWFDARFSGEKVPTVDEVLQLVAQYQQHDILVAVDLKADDIAQDVAQLAEQHKVLHRLLFIGSAISDDLVRNEIKAASKNAQVAVVANTTDEFVDALKATDGDWVYFRYLPSQQQIKAVHQAGKRAFIAGSTVSGNLPENWRKAASIGIDAVLTDYPLDLSKFLQTNK